MGVPAAMWPSYQSSQILRKRGHVLTQLETETDSFTNPADSYKIFSYGQIKIGKY